MTKAIKKLFSLMHRYGHPVLWGTLFVALYGTYHYYERWYWETPSIPFQPFCSPANRVDHLRPAKGITMSRAFEDEAIKAMTRSGVTMNVVFNVSYEPVTQHEPRARILVAPKDFDDGMKMIWATEEAIYEVRGPGPWLDGKPIVDFRSVPLDCEDVEGVIKEF